MSPAPPVADRPVTDPADVLARALDRVRPSVRRERPYVVGGLAEPDVKLNQNESPYDLPEALKAALARVHTETAFHRYPAEQPERLAAALAARHGVERASIIVSHGSNDLTTTLGMAFLAPGTAVVLPRPMFALWEKVVHLFDARLVDVPCLADFSFDVDGLDAAIARERPAYAVVTTPNNPTGLAVTFDAIERLATTAADAGSVLVVDEAYAEFVPETPSASTLIGRFPNVVVVRTFSKAFGLAGLRLGYLVAAPEMAAELMKPRLPFTVTPFDEAVALAVLAEDSYVTGIANDLALRTQQLRRDAAERAGVTTHATVANFFLLGIAGMDGRAMQDAFARHGVAVRGMGGYAELAALVRVSCGTEAENRRFLLALDALASDAASAPPVAPADAR